MKIRNKNKILEKIAYLWNSGCYSYRDYGDSNLISERFGFIIKQYNYSNQQLEEIVAELIGEYNLEYYRLSTIRIFIISNKLFKHSREKIGLGRYNIYDNKIRMYSIINLLPRPIVKYLIMHELLHAISLKKEKRKQTIFNFEDHLFKKYEIQFKQLKEIREFMEIFASFLLFIKRKIKKLLKKNKIIINGEEIKDFSEEDS